MRTRQDMMKHPRLSRWVGLSQPKHKSENHARPEDFSERVSQKLRSKDEVWCVPSIGCDAFRKYQTSGRRVRPPQAE